MHTIRLGVRSIEIAAMAESDRTQPLVKVLCFLPSGYSQRVELALAWKGIPYERIEENIYDKSPFLIASNPVYKAVPVLIHGDLSPLCESAIIVQYIDEAWPCPERTLLPSDPHARAMARFWADFIDKKLFDAMVRILMTEGEKQKVAIEESKECLSRMEEVLEGVSRNGEGGGKTEPFFGGEEMGFVDIILGPLAVWREAFETAAEAEFPWELQYPRLHAWLSAFRRSAVADVLPDPGKLTDYALNVVRKKYVVG